MQLADREITGITEFDQTGEILPFIHQIRDLHQGDHKIEAADLTTPTIEKRGLIVQSLHIGLLTTRPSSRSMRSPLILKIRTNKISVPCIHS